MTAAFGSAPAANPLLLKLSIATVQMFEETGVWTMEWNGMECRDRVRSWLEVLWYNFFLEDDDGQLQGHQL